MRQRTAAIVGGGAAVVLLGVLIGSQVVHGSGVCSAVGRVETVQVDLVGGGAGGGASGAGGVSGHASGGLPAGVSAVDEVRLCSQAGCSLPLGTESTPDPTTGVETGPPFAAERVSAAKWVFAISGVRPLEVTATAFDGAGRSLAKRTYDLRWSRADPASQCDTSLSTPPLRLAVPAP